MLKNIKEKFLSSSKLKKSEKIIYRSEFLLLEIPFILATLVVALFVGGYLVKYLKTNYFILTFIVSFIACFYLIIRICKTKSNLQEKSPINFLKTRAKKLTFLSIFVIWQFFNFTGFCYQEMRYLSDKELIDRVVNQQFVDEEDGAGHYESVEDFYEKNPNCCEVNHFPINEGSRLPKWETIFGGLFGFGGSNIEMSISRVDEHFNRDSERKNIQDFPYIHIYFGTDYCGNLGSNFGQGITEEDHNNYLKRKFLINKNYKK